MLTTQVSRKLELPHEPGEWIEVRGLSLHAVGQAKEVLRRARAGGVDLEAEEQLLAIAEPLLHQAIKAWSYDAPVSNETIDDLDVATAIFVLTELLPKAPATEEEKAAEEADRKNVSSPSTAPSTGKGRRQTNG